MGLVASRAARSPDTVAPPRAEHRVSCEDVGPAVLRAVTDEAAEGRLRRVVVDCRRGGYDEHAVAALQEACGGPWRLVFEF